MACSTGRILPGCRSAFYAHVLTLSAQIANFLNHMASRVRLDALRPKVNGMLNSEDDAAVSWNPMRRKMQIRPD